MKAIPNDLIHAVNSLSHIYRRDGGHDVAKFMTYESKLQYREAYKRKDCNHYSDEKATRSVTLHAYLVFERYLQIQNYKKLKEDLKYFDENNIGGE